MKKIVCLLMTLCFVASFSLQAQEKENSKKVKEPEITFEKTVYNYGHIYQGDNGVCEFVFKNTGKADLVLTNVHSSCGCTVPEWPKETIAPGKKGVIKVKYDTERLGTISKTITVESNATNNRVILSIKGKISERPAEVAPEKTESEIMIRHQD